MRRVTAIFVFFLAFITVVTSGHADQAPDTLDSLQLFSSSQVGLPPYNGGEKNRVSPSTNKSLVLLNLGNNGLTVKTQYLEKPSEKSPGLEISDQSQGQFSALATSSIIERFLTAEGEFAYSSFNSKSFSVMEPGEGQNRLLRVGLKGAWADYSYGAEYRSVEKNFMNLTAAPVAVDQDGEELWAQKKFGIFGLKLSASEFTDNLAGDPARPQISKLQGGASVSVASGSWPVLSFFYFKGSQWSSNEPAGSHPQTGTTDSAGTSLLYKAGQWDTTLSSTYSLSDITSNLGKQPFAAGRFHLNSSRIQTNTPVLALGLNYRPSILPVQVNTFGSYAMTRASDGYTSTDVFNLSASLNWTLGDSRIGKNTLSLGTTFNRSLDNITPASSTQDVSVWVRLTVAAF